MPLPHTEAEKSESEKSLSHIQLLWPHGLYSPWNSLGQNTGVSNHSLLQGIFPTQVSCITGTFFTIWATREPKNTGVGSLSLLQQIFLTQESNRGLLHYRQIVYQLSYLYSIFTSFYLSIPIFSHDNNYYGKYRNRLVVLGKSVAMW